MGKTKEEKAQSRAEGRRQAVASFKNLVNDQYNGLNDVASGASKIISGDILDGMKTIGKAVGTTAIKNIKNLGSWIGGIFKGLFNDPRWYQAFGFMPKPAINEHRPYAPRYANPKHVDSGMFEFYLPLDRGVGHVVDVYFEFQDLLESEAFQLATQEAYRLLRLALKSNLVYTLEHFQMYVQTVISIMILAKQMERAVGFTKMYRSDIPNIQELLSTVSNSETTEGWVTLKKIVAIDQSGSEYATTLTREIVLAEQIKQLVIPDNLYSWINWLAGSAFIDQSAPNPQIYLTHFRRVPIYGVRADGTYGVTDYVDASEVTINNLISYIVRTLDYFGLANADIMKSGVFRFPNYVRYSEYNPILLDDKEFFNVLINGYTADVFKTEHYNEHNEEYSPITPDGTVRFDLLPNATTDEQASSTNGMGALIVSPVLIAPFKVMAQCLKLNVKKDMKIISGLKGAVQVINGAVVPWEDLDEELVGIQFNSSLDDVISIESAGTVQLVYLNDQQTANIVATTSSGSLYIKSFTFTGPADGNDAQIRLAKCGNYILRLDIPRTTGSTATATIKVSTNGGSTYNTFGTVTITIVPSEITSGIYSFYVPTFNFTLPGGNYADLLACVTTNGGNQVVWGHYNNNYPAVFDYLSLQGSSASVYTIVNSKAAELGFFIENVDYHIPIFYSQNLKVDTYVNGENFELYSYGPISLFKECYIPVTTTIEELENVLYLMWSSLLRVNVAGAAAVMNDAPNMQNSKKRYRNKK